MSAPTADTVSELQSLRYQARVVNQVLRLNIDGVTHAESLRQPQPAGNCLNWIVGHLVWAYAGALPLLDQEPVLDQASLSRYARGAPPLGSPAEAREFGELVAAWDEEASRVDAGLAAFPTDALNLPAPSSPTGNPDETIRTLLATVLFHQAYHAGQAAVLRRIIGKPGAIA
jgi:Uncharacterized protein conserved in bacteria